MTLEEVKQKLKVFDKYTFEEDTHTYYCNGKKVGIGVTSLIGLYANKFDEQEVAERVLEKNIKNYNYAKTQLKLYYPSGSNVNTEYLQELYNYLKLPITIQDILAEWHYKRDFSCEKGTTIHEYTQSLFSGNEWHLRSFDSSKEYLEVVEKIKHHSNNYYNDYKDRYIHIKDELLIGVEWADISSAIDHLFYDKVDKGIVIVDYKTNSYMEGYYDNPDKKVYKKYMMIPFQDTLDNSYEHYKIQLSIYKYILQELLGIPVLRTEIVYLTENKDNYEVIQIPYLKNEVEKILKLRRANKMAKMILVMGEPASGKTVSLRNIPKNELYYIDCDKKGLNYKGWKNDFNEENKNYFKTNDGELIAKCMQGISEKREDIHYIVIDTINSIMIADEMRRSKDKNFDKWIDLASCIFNLVNIVPDLRDDITVIFIGHTQTDDEGFTRLLTNGKKLNKIGLEKYFDTVLIAKNNDGKYVFETKSPNSTARTPMGSYDDEQYIDNDLYEVIKTLKEY